MNQSAVCVEKMSSVLHVGKFRGRPEDTDFIDAMK
jgi:hypothetical protein